MCRILLSLLLVATTCNAFAQEPPYMAVEEAQPAQLQEFRKALLTASGEAYKAGEISRLDVFKIRIASLNKTSLQKMQMAVAEQAVFEGKATPSTLDWSTLVFFIKDILPLILELIKLFS